MTQRCLCHPPITQHALSTDSMSGTVLDAERRENQIQVLLPWRPQSSEPGIAQRLHQQRAELSLCPLTLSHQVHVSYLNPVSLP